MTFINKIGKKVTNKVKKFNRSKVGHVAKPSLVFVKKATPVGTVMYGGHALRSTLRKKQNKGSTKKKTTTKKKRTTRKTKK